MNKDDQQHMTDLAEDVARRFAAHNEEREADRRAALRRGGESEDFFAGFLAKMQDLYVPFIRAAEKEMGGAGKVQQEEYQIRLMVSGSTFEIAAVYHQRAVRVTATHRRSTDNKEDCFTLDDLTAFELRQRLDAFIGRAWNQEN